jgi:hypothetical protein
MVANAAEIRMPASLALGRSAQAIARRGDPASVVDAAPSESGRPASAPFLGELLVVVRGRKHGAAHPIGWNRERAFHQLTRCRSVNGSNLCSLPGQPKGPMVDAARGSI